MTKILMMSTNNILRAMMVLCGATLLYGCTDEDTINNNCDERLITFTAEDNWVDDVVMAKPRSQQTRQDIFPLVSEDSTKTLYINTTITDFDEPAAAKSSGTRAEPMETVGDIENFKVYGYIYTKNNSNQYVNEGPPPYMEDVITRSGTEGNFTWQGNGTYFWPGDAYWLRFFAHTPSSSSSYLTGPTYPNTYLTYEVPADVADQQDLMFANTESVVEGGYIRGDHGEELPLSFSHILTAVTFSVDQVNFAGTIKSISLNGVRYKGVFDLSQAQTGNFTWSSLGDVRDFTQDNLDKSFSQNQATDILSGATTFMMMPQTVPYHAEIVVVVQNGDNEFTLSSKIEGHTWPVGKKVNYKISASGVFFDVGTREIQEFENKAPDAQAREFTVKSRHFINGEIVYANWTCEFYRRYDDGTDEGIEKKLNAKPDWLVFKVDGSDYDPNKSEGYASGLSYTINIEDRTNDGQTVDAWLQSIPVPTSGAGSSTSPYNLSSPTGALGEVQNTANCYIINAPGHYTLPLVYGNAIKDGADNPRAYQTGSATNTENHILENFINHTGNAITSPWIQDMVTPASAGLVWQDAKSLVNVTGLEQRNGKYFLNFEITQTNIQQGNAVIAVKDEGDNVLWSWHIWVTDWNPDDGDGRNHGYELKKSRSNVTNREYTIMSNNLGWCDGGVKTYPGDEVIIRFSQVGVINGDTKDVVVRRKKITEVTESDGSAPYYQWGRKDPIVPSNGKVSDTGTKPYYVGNATTSTTTVTAGVGWYTASSNNGTETTAKQIISKGIMNPLNPYRSEYMDRRFHNLWGVKTPDDTDAEENVKTIYDPCPVGYKVPVIDVFGSLTSDGNNYTNSGMNTTMGKYTKTRPAGLYIHTTTVDAFFPASGYRAANSNHATLTIAADGWYWSAISSAVNQYYPSYHMDFNDKGYIYTCVTSASRGIGMSMRPVKEKTNVTPEW